MSKIRMKTAREVYVEQFPHNRKKKSFTRLRSYDDSDVAYRSAPEYLRQLLNTSHEQSVKSMTRTRSASEMSPGHILNRSTGGNPKYKAQEDYYDEIQFLKKDLKYVKDDNSNLRAKIRRLEEDNARKRKEIEGLFETSKDGDSRRTSIGSTIPVNNVVMNLKQRIFKLESQLRHREIAIDELKTDPRWTKSTELEIQNRALYNEIEKQKLERANIIHHDYMSSIDEEKKNAVKKLELEKRELKTENDNLKKRTHDLEKAASRHEQSSARYHDGHTTDRELHLKERCRNLENDLEQVRRERDRFRDKFEMTSEALKHGRHDHDMDDRRHDHDRASKDHLTGRSSSGLKRDDTHRSLSPRSSTKALHDDFDSWDDHNKKDSRLNVALHKSNEHLTARSSSSKLDRDGHSPSSPHRSAAALRESARNLHRDERISDDEDSRGDRAREKRLENESFANKSRHDISDTRNSRITGLKSSETHLAHGSQHKLGSKTDHLGSGVFKSRPVSAHMSQEAALQILQASLRGCITRMECDKTSRTQDAHRFDIHEEESGKTPWKQSGSERQRESFLNNSRPNLGNGSYLHHDTIGSNNRNSTSNFRQTPPPYTDSIAAKSTTPLERNKLGFGRRIDHDLHSESRGSPLPTADIHRSTSPSYGSGGLKQSVVDDKSKFTVYDRDLTSRLQRPSSPSVDQQRVSRQSNNSLRKSPTDLKHSLKNSHNDDDDVEMF